MGNSIDVVLKDIIEERVLKTRERGLIDFLKNDNRYGRFPSVKEECLKKKCNRICENGYCQGDPPIIGLIDYFKIGRFEYIPTDNPEEAFFVQSKDEQQCSEIVAKILIFVQLIEPIELIERYNDALIETNYEKINELIKLLLKNEKINKLIELLLEYKFLKQFRELNEILNQLQELQKQKLDILKFDEIIAQIKSLSSFKKVKIDDVGEQIKYNITEEMITNLKSMFDYIYFQGMKSEWAFQYDGNKYLYLNSQPMFFKAKKSVKRSKKIVKSIKVMRRTSKKAHPKKSARRMSKKSNPKKSR